MSHFLDSDSLFSRSNPLQMAERFEPSEERRHSATQSLRTFGERFGIEVSKCAAQVFAGIEGTRRL